MASDPVPEQSTPPISDSQATGWSGVKDAGVAADKGSRRRMEDTHSLVDNFAGSTSSSFFAVYDGHGGKTIAEYCAANFHNVLATHVCAISDEDFSSENGIEMFKTVYSEVDEALKTAMPTSGACVVTALVRTIGTKRWLFVANAGDARAILAREKEIVRLSFDHKPTVEEEAKRLVASGAFIRDGRVNAMIGITRALGDHCMKQWIISTPHVTAVELLESDDYLVLACDGVWDVISDEEAVEIVRNNNQASAATLAKTLAAEALKRGSQDNISVIVVKL